MRKLMYYIVAWALFLCGTSAAQPWHDVTSGIEDKRCYAIAEDIDKDGTVYVGTDAALYTYTPQNGQWKRLFMCRGEYSGINHIAMGGNGVLYIATKKGLFASSDRGSSWRRLFKGYEVEDDCTRVLIDARDASRIYLGTRKGMFRSDNGGKTWSRFRDILGDAAIEAMALSLEEAPEGYLFAVGDNELYRIHTKTSMGEKIFGSSLHEESGNMEMSEESEETVMLHDIIYDRGTLYVSTNRGLFVSEGADGAVMRFTGAGLTNRHIYSVAPAGENDILAATGAGVFKYVHEKERWESVHSGIAIPVATRLLVDAPNGYLWALCRDRVYRSLLTTLRDHGGDMQDVRGLLSHFEHEPDIREVQTMAISYAEVHPGKIKKWRRGAQLKALLPKVDLGIDRSWSDTYEIYTSSSKSYWLYGPHDRAEGWDLNLSWDLSDLVWNESQTSIDVRSKLMVQLRDDILDEVTRLYFERRRLQLDLLVTPPPDVSKALEKNLRLQELTASIDGLTGGSFSERIRQEK